MKLSDMPAAEATYENLRSSLKQRERAIQDAFGKTHLVEQQNRNCYWEVANLALGHIELLLDRLTYVLTDKKSAAFVLAIQDSLTLLDTFIERLSLMNGDIKPQI